MPRRQSMLLVSARRPAYAYYPRYSPTRRSADLSAAGGVCPSEDKRPCCTASCSCWLVRFPCCSRHWRFGSPAKVMWGSSEGDTPSGGGLGVSPNSNLSRAGGRESLPAEGGKDAYVTLSTPTPLILEGAGLSPQTGRKRRGSPVLPAAGGDSARIAIANGCTPLTTPAACARLASAKMGGSDAARPNP
jgi:hypothetical protein